MYTYGIPAVIVRPFNNYGPCQHIEKAIPNFIVSALQNQPLTIHWQGLSSRDWTFVSDTCDGIDKILHIDLETISGQTINLGSEVDVNVLDIAKMILKIMNKPESLINYVEDRPGQVTRHTASAKKAHDLLGWKTSIKLKEGLEKTIMFYRNNSKWWERYLWMKELWGGK